MTQSSSSSDDKQSNPQDRRSLAGLNAGYTLVASVILGLGLGYWLDSTLGTTPWWTAGGGVLFIIAGLYQVVKEFQEK